MHYFTSQTVFQYILTLGVNEASGRSETVCLAKITDLNNRLETYYGEEDRDNGLKGLQRSEDRP